MRRFEVARGYEDKGVILPTRGTGSSAGYDIRVLTPDKKEVVLQPKETYIFHTGIKALMQEDEVLLLFIRSSMGIKQGLRLLTSVSVIDCDYYGNEDNDGEICIGIVNTSETTQVIENNQRLVQGVFIKYLITDNDAAVKKRHGGVGSTGKD